MKKVLLFFLLLITLIMNRSMIFAVEDINSDLDENEVIQLKKEVSDLLNERSDLWNKLFSEETKLEEISEDLKEIVVDPLLTYDIEAFGEIKNEHTGMERILNVEVLTINNVKATDDEINIDVEVEWLMEGFEKNYKEKVLYSMKLLSDDNKWKISDYNVK